MKDRFPKEAAEAERKLEVLKAEAKVDFEKADALAERAERALGSDRTRQVLLNELDKMIAVLK